MEFMRYSRFFLVGIIYFVSLHFDILAIEKASESFENIIKEDEVYVAVEQPAEFPEGQGALMRWLGEHIEYPAEAKAQNIQGRVVVKFIIEKDGTVSHAEVARGVNKLLDQEAIRVVMSMPKWIPGKNNGETVRSYFNLPVTFRITEPEPAKP